MLKALLAVVCVSSAISAWASGTKHEITGCSFEVTSYSTGEYVGSSTMYGEFKMSEKIAPYMLWKKTEGTREVFVAQTKIAGAGGILQVETSIEYGKLRVKSLILENSKVVLFAYGSAYATTGSTAALNVTVNVESPEVATVREADRYKVVDLKLLPKNQKLYSVRTSCRAAFTNP